MSAQHDDLLYDRLAIGGGTEGLSSMISDMVISVRTSWVRLIMSASTAPMRLVGTAEESMC